jgi:TonB-linked SusC/RagA family outer membrane protein
MVFLAFTGYGQTVEVKGNVTDAQGEPLIGVSVLQQGTTNGTVTGADGDYRISVPADATVRFSYVGYLSQEVKVGKRTRVDVRLVDDTQALEEVVVVGYGIQKKSSVTGAISQIKSNDIESRTITNVEQALQGKAAGVQVVQTSGSPGASQIIRVRGYSSNTTSDPLFIVDGLRVPIANVSRIDPNNIETMEILKDAASAAIYGSEAGNGVVLITTKMGKKGTSSIAYDFQYTSNSLARIPKVMQAHDFIDYLLESKLRMQEQIDAVWDGKTDTDWADVAFENSFMTRHNLNMQGGNDKGSYFLSLGFLDNDGIIKGDRDVFNRLSATVNADYQLKTWLKVGTNIGFEKYKRRNVSENSEYGSLLAAVLNADPLTPNLYEPGHLPAFMNDLLNSGHRLLTNEDGKYYGISQILQGEQVHPMILRDRVDSTSDGFNLRGVLTADFTPLKGFVYTSRLGFNSTIANSNSFSHIYYVNPTIRTEMNNTSQNMDNTLYYQWENFANYNFKIKEHDVTLMAGMAYSDMTSANLRGAGDKLIKTDPDFRYLDYVDATATKTVGGSYNNYSRKLSYFGRANYNYANKYLLQASLRRDAADSSVLPIAQRWGTFPAVSLGYIVSNESFFPEHTPVTQLKLRASWGQNGSLAGLSNFSYANSITSGAIYAFTTSVNYVPASYPNRLSNPELKWETSEQLDFGLDVNAFNNRLTATLDWFSKTTIDLIVQGTPPLETGNVASPVNAGNVSNKGFEVELGWRDVMNGFSYGIRGNMATLKNKVTYLDENISRLEGTTMHTYGAVSYFEKGYPVWYFRGFQMSGVDPATGDPVFVDQVNIDSNGDGVFDTTDGAINTEDKVMIGSAIPDFTYGLTLTAGYKGFDFTCFGAGSYGNDIFCGLTYRDDSNNLKVFFDERWTPGNPNAKRPRPAPSNMGFYMTSDAFIFDASFFKIKQIQLGYTLPVRLTKKIALNHARVYGSLEDFFTFTSYPGMDPEASAGSTTSMGIDKGSYPNSKKVLVGISLTF